MSQFHSHINTAAHLINNYKGDLPLKHYLQQYFSQNKKHGSKDRKHIAQLCYSYYRMGHANKQLSTEERLQMAIEAPVSLFPWKELLSDGIDATAFEGSFLTQPDLFLRIRPGKKEAVLHKLNEKEIAYHQPSPFSLAFANTTKIEDVLEIDKEVVVQDLSSQRVGELMKDVAAHLVWDCCAASGGKSIMAADLLKDVQLAVSDIRPSIIHNLKERFKRAGINKYQSFIADLASPSTKLPNEMYDLIIADVPCSGSGTWARTPEQLYFFEANKIDHYRNLQEKIVSKVMTALKPGGTLLYITCSVFRKENEDMVKYIKENTDLDLDKMELQKGYGEKADSMFVARFINYDRSSLA